MAIEEHGREDEDQRPMQEETQDDRPAAQEAGAGQFAFGGHEERLPWLDSGDEDEPQQVDAGRILAFALIGLALVGLIVGGIWWVAGPRGSEPVADGGTIEAPAGPVKTRPEDPGGKTFEGTGDTSFAVGEGLTREGVVAGDAAPSIDAATVESTRAEAAAMPAAGVGVQVGAYSTRQRAEQGWSELVGQHDVLQGLPHRVIEGQADIGRVFRLQAVASDRAAADALCARIRAGGGACQVKP